MKRAKDKRVGTLLLGRMLSVLLSAHLAVGMLPVEAIAEVRVEALGEEVAASDSEMQDDESLDSIARGRSLNDFAVGAEVLGGEQRPDAIAVEEGAAYDVVVSFAENEGLQFAEDGELAYALPEGFEPTEDQPGFTGKLAVSNGVTDEAGFELAVENMRVEDGAVRFGWNTEDENYERFASVADAGFELTIRGMFAAGTNEVTFAQEPTAVEVVAQESPEEEVAEEIVPENATSTEEEPVEETAEQALPETDAPEERVTEDTPEEQTKIPEERSDETDTVQSDALSDNTTAETQKEDDAELPQATESEDSADKNTQKEATESKAATPASKASEMTIAMGDAIAEISSAGDEQWYRFVPPTSGTYVFESFGSDDTYGCIYDAARTPLVSDDDGGDGWNFMVSGYLTGGTTYYLAAKYLSTLNTGSIRLSLSMSASVGTTYAKVASEGEVARLRFVPPTSGDYAFGSVSTDDTYGTLYDRTGTYLEHDDDSGENSNFEISRYLDAESPCFLDVRYYSPYDTGTIAVRIANGTSVSGPAITSQPSSVTVDEDATATFSVDATGDGLSYQWQYQASDSSSWSNTSATGCTTNTMRVKATAGLNGRKFRCVVTDQNGNSVTSSEATLMVRAKPKITRQPTNVTANEDATATFSVAATGDGISYQWQYQARGASTWQNTSATGCKTATLKVKATAGLNGRKFRCVVTDRNGKRATSSAATLTVRAKLKITRQPSSVTANECVTATFSVATRGDGISYQWQYQARGASTWNNTSATGCKTATLKVKATAGLNGRKFRCV